MPTATSSDLRAALLILRQEQNGALSHAWESEADVVAAALRGDSKAEAQVSQFLNGLLPGLVGDYQYMAAAIAADWYDNERAAQQVAGSFTAKVLIPDAGIPSLVGYAFSKATTTEGLEQFIAGGVSLRTTQAANGTLMSSNLADPEGRGWERQAAPDACWFCRLLASRGAVYKSQATATFAPHDSCHCVAVCAWNGTTVSASTTYTPTERNISEPVRRRMYAQARSWAEGHGLIEGDLSLAA